MQPLLQQHARSMDENLANAIAPLQESINKTNEAIALLQQRLDDDAAMSATVPSDARVDDITDRLGKIEATPATTAPSSSPTSGSGSMPNSGSQGSGLRAWERPLPRTLFSDRHLGNDPENAFVLQARASPAPPHKF